VEQLDNLIRNAYSEHICTVSTMSYNPVSISTFYYSVQPWFCVAVFHKVVYSHSLPVVSPERCSIKRLLRKICAKNAKWQHLYGRCRKNI